MVLLGACDTSRQMSKDNPADASLIKDQFIVKLAPDVKPEALAAEFEQQGLSIKKAIVPSMNLWLFTYGQASMKPEKMLKKIRASTLVKEAEFDKKLSPR